MLRGRVVVGAVIWFTSVLACNAQVVPPSADPGQVPQRFEPPSQPKALPRTEDIILPSTLAPNNAAQINLTVARFEITRATVFSGDELADLTDPLIGKPISLSEIYALAARITARYGEAGYVLSRAVVPPQSLGFKNATVRIDVVEGYVDDVIWPSSLQRFRDYFSDYAAQITQSRPANIRIIERNLLLASDLPGLSFTSTFHPSKSHSRASTLIVTAREKPVDLESSIDNRGSEGRGPWQARVAGTANNWLGQHEALSINYATAVPSTEQLRFIEGTWRQVLNSEGLTFIFDGSYNTGIPGLGALEAIDYDSRGVLFTGTLSYPVIRLRDENLIVSGIVFTEDVESQALDAPFTEDRLRGFRARVAYDRADALGGINFLQLTLSHGVDGLASTGNDNPLASRIGGRVDFTKIEAYASRSQPLPYLLEGLSLYGAVYGQYARDPLLVVEQCSYGGKYFGRAFDPSIVTGDNCITGLLEMRYDFAIPDNIFDRTQIYGFVDHGLIERKLFSAGTPEREWGSSAGVGLRLGWQEKISASIEAARGVDGDFSDNEWHAHGELTMRY